MGNTCTSVPEFRPRLVIVGGSWSAFESFQALHREFEIKIIDSKDFIEVTPAMHYYYTGQIPHEAISLPIKDSVIRDNFIHGKAVELQPNAVVVRTEFGLQTVDFDYCIVATGSTYPSSFKADFQFQTLSEHRAKIKAVQDKVLKAKNVLVRGAGIVGVEVAAELATLGKKVTLACPRGEILPRFTPKVGRRARPDLDEVGVKIVDSKKEVISVENYDLVYECTGNIWPTEENILNKNFMRFRDGQGRVRVNEFFQICDQEFNPINHIFAVGDCCITQANEEKNIGNLRKGVAVLAHNLKEFARKGKDGRLRFKEFPKDHKKIGQMGLISLGRRSLLVIGNLTTIGEYLTSMKKGLGPKIIKELALKQNK